MKLRGRGQLWVNGWPDKKKWIHFLESVVQITLGGQVSAGLVKVLGSRSICVGGLGQGQ